MEKQEKMISGLVLSFLAIIGMVIIRVHSLSRERIIDLTDCSIIATLQRTDKNISLEISCDASTREEISDPIAHETNKKRMVEIYGGVETIYWNGSHVPRYLDFCLEYLIDSRSVKYLSIEEFWIQSISFDEFNDLINLSRLYLQGNYIEEVSESIFYVQKRKLKQFLLNENKIKTIKSTGGYHSISPVLEKLMIIESSLRLTNAINMTSWKKLMTLSISCRYLAVDQLQLLPPTLTFLELRDIKSLDDKSVTLTDLPQLMQLQIVKVGTLETLTIGQKESKLRALILTNNKLRQLHVDSALPSVKYVNVAENQLTDLSWLQQLPGAIEVNVSFNSLAGEIDLSNIKGDLDHLDLRYNQIQIIKCNRHCADATYKIMVNKNDLDCDWLRSIEHTPFFLNRLIFADDYELTNARYNRPSWSCTEHNYFYISPFSAFFLALYYFCATVLLLFLLGLFLHRRIVAANQQHVPFYRALSDFVRTPQTDQYSGRRKLPPLEYEDPLVSSTETMLSADLSQGTEASTYIIYEEIPEPTAPTCDESTLPRISLRIKDQEFLERVFNELYGLRSTTGNRPTSAPLSFTAIPGIHQPSASAPPPGSPPRENELSNGSEVP